MWTVWNSVNKYVYNYMYNYAYNYVYNYVYNCTGEVFYRSYAIKTYVVIGKIYKKYEWKHKLGCRYFKHIFTNKLEM
jgi:hypothetical protein